MIGARIRALRKARKLTQPRLAALSGVQQSAISRIEKGPHTSMRIENFQAIARALGVSMEDLLRVKPLRNTRPKRVAS